MTTPAAAPTDQLPHERAVPDRLPVAAWWLAAASVLAQGAAFADRGMKSDEGWTMVVSMLIGALVIWWFASGVLSARTGRLVVTWLLLGLVLVAESVSVVGDALDGRAGMPVVHLATSVLMLGSLWWFTRTPYFAWQRTRPTHPGPSRVGVLAVAVLVGLSAGVVQPDPDGLSVQLNAAG